MLCLERKLPWNDAKVTCYFRYRHGGFLLSCCLLSHVYLKIVTHCQILLLIFPHSLHLFRNDLILSTSFSHLVRGFSLAERALTDKGNGVVILDRNIYLDSCFDILNDKSKFKVLDKDPTFIKRRQT